MTNIPRAWRRTLPLASALRRPTIWEKSHYQYRNPGGRYSCPASQMLPVSPRWVESRGRGRQRSSVSSAPPEPLLSQRKMLGLSGHQAVRGEDILLRAATGDDLTDFLTTVDGTEDDDCLESAGGIAEPTCFFIDWCQAADSEVIGEPGCRLWCGEVVSRSGGGVADPSYVHEQAAGAGAFSKALQMAKHDVLEAPVVPYACARSYAPGLRRIGGSTVSGPRRLGHGACRSRLFCRPTRLRPLSRSNRSVRRAGSTAC